MAVGRKDYETGTVHAVDVDPVWGIAPAACGRRPSILSGWSSSIYPDIGCDECRDVLAKRIEWARLLSNHMNAQKGRENETVERRQ